MPNAEEILGGFHAAVPSPLVDAYAQAVSLLEAAAARPAEPVTRLWTLRADRAVQVYAANGRSVVGYPRPDFDPLWLSDSLAAPTVVLSRDTDYQIDATSGLILFEVDPITYARVYPVWVAGAPVAACDLWAAAAGVSPEPVIPQPSTPAGLAAALAAACDSPATGELTETVEGMFQSTAGWRVVTDRATYRLGLSDIPSVTTGAVLAPGSPVGSAWVLTRLGPNKPNLPYLTTPASFHQGATAGGITWYDETVPTVVDTVSGRTRLRFRLGASSQADLNAFWAASHANGVGPHSYTLAQALDLRVGGTGDPDVHSLPTTVNPLVLVCRELLAGNAYLLVVAPEHFGPAAVDAVTRARATAAAAGPYCAVFEYTDTVPALTWYDPS